MNEGVSAALSANMEQLNTKRNNLKESEAILNQQIAKKETFLREIDQNLVNLHAK